MKINSFLLVGVFICAGSAFAAPICPTTANNSTGADSTGCGVLITDAPTGATLSLTGTGPYDGSEDMTVGLINNTGKSLTSFTLTSTGADAFGFDGDGIQTFASNNGVAIPTGGATGYEGPNMTYNLAGVTGGDGTLVINFTTPLANGADTYFSLEGAPSTSGIGVGPGGGTSTPEPASMALLGSGMLGMGGLAFLRRRK